MGLRLWADDHGGKYGWVVDQGLGGGKPDGTDNATVGFQFALASNELASPKILLCPSDLLRKPATNFVNIATNKVSYDLGGAPLMHFHKAFQCEDFAAIRTGA